MKDGPLEGGVGVVAARGTSEKVPCACRRWWCPVVGAGIGRR